MKRFASLLVLTFALLLTAGCVTSPAVGQDRAVTPWDKASTLQQSDIAAKGWQHRTFPGKKPNQFSHRVLDGRVAMAVRSNAAASVLHKTVNLESGQLGTLRFSWRKAALIADADMSLREKDDALRLVLAFDGDRTRLSARDHMMSELARTLTGEEMPYATLMYVWSNQREVGSVVANPRTDRIRKLVVESGQGRLGQWLDYERDIRADYRRVFGEEPGRLLAVGLMTDTDNTRSSVQTWYGPVSFEPSPTAGAVKLAP